MLTSPNIRSFKTKLTLVMMLSTTLAVALVCAALILFQYVQTRQQFSDSALSQARIMALNLGAALAFEDAGTATEVLQALSAEPAALQATVFKSDGSAFAAFNRPGPDGLQPVAAQRPHDDHSGAGSTRPDAIHFNSSHLLADSVVTVDGESLGKLTIVYDLRPMRNRMLQGILISTFAGLLACVLAAGAARLLRRGLSAPITELNRVADAVRDTQDFTLRAKRFNDDELGDLTDGFNTMLERVEQADARNADRQRTAGKPGDRTYGRPAIRHARSRSGQPGQELFPGQHVARNPHPHDGHSGLQRDAAGSLPSPSPNASTASRSSTATAGTC